MRTFPFFILLRHLIQLARCGQIRFRLETFGVYYPAPQYDAPWWRVTPRSVLLLLRRGRSYALWLAEMDRMTHRGGAAWWDRA